MSDQAGPWCRQSPETRRCPLSLPDGCGDGPCMRFEAEETPEVVAIWERHWDIWEEQRRTLTSEPAP